MERRSDPRPGRARARDPRRAIACAAAAFGALAATCSLPAVRGRVVDTATGAPIAGAVVFERIVGAGAMGEPPPTRHARFATSDGDGRFVLEPEAVSGARGLRRGYGPSYGFAHPDYGLVRGVEPPGDGDVVLRGDRESVAARTALATLCTTPPREAWERTLRTRVCPARPERPPAAR